MFISPAAHEMLRRSEVIDGDLLVTITGNVGRVVKLAGVGKANLNQHIARVRVQTSSVDRDFVYQFLLQGAVRKRFDSITTGQAYPQISLKQVRDAVIAFPPIGEQRAIAKALSDLDALIDRVSLLLTKKRDLKQAAMQQLLMGRTRLAAFNKKWERKKLGELGRFLKGAGVRKNESLSGEIPCVRYGEIYTHHYDRVRSFHSWISAAVARTATELRSGDLLFAGSGETKEEIGKSVAYVHNAKAYAGGDIVILRPYAADAVFLGYCLNAQYVQSQKADRGQGDAVVHISAAALATIEIQLPSREEQSAIAAVLSDMDTAIASLESRREKLNAVKKGMMQQLLTGRIRLI